MEAEYIDKPSAHPTQAIRKNPTFFDAVTDLAILARRHQSDTSGHMTPEFKREYELIADRLHAVGGLLAMQAAAEYLGVLGGDYVRSDIDRGFDGCHGWVR
jgi:hypothetical protein